MGTSRTASALILKMLGIMLTATGALGVLFTVVGLRAAAWERTWAKAGIVTGAIAVFLPLTGLPVALVPNPWLEPMVG